ncbi:right-handed parallel beta-helix repeat-containing protein [Luteimonas sp. MC1572]|uniref:right-handed parallel beta-helix repeat-containing protein n=1 Tax=Luteimonas sp. MC1572 TaxID=2799325 RepID=UPI0018F0BC53|nr:right-handed parallel beta-helix repeat-containing protein [Luteimonas sp. MC1572]MBJ6982873.1 right-handed parallel beta-helix repeat-containing protein [Luteimonas sp. MC1572]QQO04100.1 right-handed parallel beta-helix repeat-containing protein [Luteimonas sp. MC1572]
MHRHSVPPRYSVYTGGSPHGKRLAACWILVALAGLAAPAHAREWFVSTGGSDSNDGSLARPFRTIGHVLSPESALVRDGDTVTLRAPEGNRTYSECDVRLRVRLVLRSHPGERAHIHCDIATPDSVAVQIDPPASGSRVSGLEISGGRFYGVMMQTGWEQEAAPAERGASDIVLEDLLIRDTGRDGIKITPKSDNITIRRTEIRDTGAIYAPGTPLEEMNADGIDNVNGSGMVVEDSYIHDIATTGLYFKGGAADVVVQRNRIEDTGMAGILVGFDTSLEFFDTALNPEYHESIRGVVRNNVVRNTNYAGIGLYAAKDAVVVNNTIDNAARVGHAALYFGIPFQDWDPDGGRPPSVNATLRNNLVRGSGGRCFEIRHSDELGGLSGLTGWPHSDHNGYAPDCLLRDARPGSIALPLSLPAWRLASGTEAGSVSADFALDADGRPGAGSAAIGAGVPVDGVSDDIEGARRDGAQTIGAYHVQVPVAVPAAGGAGTGGGDAPATAQAETMVAAAVLPLAWLAGGRGITTLLPAIGAALLAALALLAMVAGAILVRRRNVTDWLAAYLRQDWRAPVPHGTTRHLMFCFVDHYEPAWGNPGRAREDARVARWLEELPRLCASHRDSEGRPPMHTFFYPEEEYRPEHLDALATLCRMGLGEIEIHLHHDNDTEAELRRKLSRFTELLASDHDALPRDPVTGQPRWAFIHGNWALDNSHPSGRHCGVDNELVVLREEGCYADFTFPAAPDPCQTRAINRIYYAKDDPCRPKSHDRGPRVRVGGSAEGDLMLIQGPLGFRWRSRKFGLVPRIENADVRAVAPPTTDRIDAWVRTGIHVEGRPEWIFVKIHTHGAEDRDMDTLLGAAMDQAHSYLESRYNDGREWKLHYVSAREAYNIAKAAEAGLQGDPGMYRDHAIPRPHYRPRRGAAATSTVGERAALTP